MWVTLIIALRIWLILSVVATFILVATINNHYRHHCRIELITASYQLCWQQGPGAFHCRIVLIMLLHSIDTLTTYAVYTCTHCTLYSTLHCRLLCTVQVLLLRPNNNTILIISLINRRIVET